MLFTISKSPNSFNLKSIFSLISENDAILFWQNGVIFTLIESEILENLQQKNIKIYVLKEDLESRGLFGYQLKSIKVIDFNELVSLTNKQFPQSAW